MADASLRRSMRWVMTTANALVVLSIVACGEQQSAVADGEGQDGSGDSGVPSNVDTPWTLAVHREAPDGAGLRVWLVGADGSDPRAIPEDPSEPPDHPLYVGWTPDGEALYVEDDGDLHFYTGDRLEPVTCPAFEMWGGSPDCVSHDDATFVLASGAIVIAKNLGAGHVPGSNPIPEAYISLVDHRSGHAEIIAESQHYTCIGIGDGPVIVATERHMRWVDDELESIYVPVMIRGGERQVLDADAPLGPCAVVTKAGDRIAWPYSDGTRVTDLELSEIASTTAGRPLAWSADGRWLAGIIDDELWMLDVEDGTTEILELPDASAVHWAPTGPRLAVEIRCRESDREVRILDRGAEIRRETCGEQRFGAWAPDAQTFAMSVQEGGVEGFRILSAHGSKAGPFVEGDPQAFRPGP